MTHHTIEETKRNKYYYRDRFRSSSTVLLVFLAIILLLVGLAAYTYFTQKEPKYYATINNGMLYELTALDEPNDSEEYLLK